MNSLVSTLEHIINGIVSDPSQIAITQSETDNPLTITVTAPDEIVGQIIGKEGKIIKSIRAILNLCYPTQRYILDVNPDSKTATQTDQPDHT
ncbi:MAG: KH domain-containing protein [Candidatus Shapirobacteria bacterium]|jgi:hypothetical protein